MKMTNDPNFQRRRSAAAGLSLIETLIAMALLMVCMLAIMPLFQKSVRNNIHGAEASRAAQLTRSNLDDFLAVNIDADQLEMNDPDRPLEEAEVLPHLDRNGVPVPNSERLVFKPQFWDPEAVVAPPPVGDPRHAMFRLGEGAWIAATETPKGDARWQSEIILRQYTYSDISAGVVDVTNTNQLAVQGHPMLFDRPLPADANPSQVHFKERHVILENRTTGVRAFDMRALRTY